MTKHLAHMRFTHDWVCSVGITLLPHFELNLLSLGLTIRGSLGRTSAVMKEP